MNCKKNLFTCCMKFEQSSSVTVVSWNGGRKALIFGSRTKCGRKDGKGCVMVGVACGANEKEARGIGPLWPHSLGL